MKGGGGPPPDVGWLGDGGGERDRVVFADVLRPVLGREEHVASADQPGQPALSDQVADDFAGRRLGAKKPDDLSGVHDFAALLP